MLDEKPPDPVGPEFHRDSHFSPMHFPVYLFIPDALRLTDPAKDNEKNPSGSGWGFQ
jgi:hypothetical protein